MNHTIGLASALLALILSVPGCAFVAVGTALGIGFSGDDREATRVEPEPTSPLAAAVWPQSGPTAGGTSVQVFGLRFQNGATVSVDDTLVTGVAFVDSASLVFTTPPGLPGARNVTVRNPDGQASTLPAAFVYVPPPDLVSLSPGVGTLAGGTIVTLTGSGFAVGATVSFGGAPASNVSVASATSIVCWTPAHAAGTVDAVVANPDGQSDALVGGYEFVEPPAISAIQPPGGPAEGGTQVTILGADFRVGASVFFAGVAASDVAIVHPGKIVCGIPAYSGGPVDVVVTNADGTSATRAGGFTYYTLLFSDTNAALPGLEWSSLSWGDYDSDGDLDLAICGGSPDLPGQRHTEIYRNDATSFTNIHAGLVGLERGKIEWIDADGDGDLDLAMMGTNGSVQQFKIYRNAGGGLFQDIGASLPGVAMGSFDWADFDNDGDLDLAITGNETSSYYYSRIFRNDGGGVFSDLNAGLTPMTNGSVSWADYDNDGDFDLVIAGADSPGPNTLASKIYRNDGSGVFSDLSAGLTPVDSCCLSWGDTDNDGDLDLALSGWGGPSVFVSKVFRNDGAGLFTDINVSLGPGDDSSSNWGDFDNDGRIDLVLAGCANTAFETHILRNEPSQMFSFQTYPLVGVSVGCVRWGDADGDGDLDLALTGYANGTRVSKIYRSSGLPFPNLAPSAPSGLDSAPSGNDVILSWNASTDPETPSPGLSYNLRVGTTSGGNNVVSGMSLPSGTRLLPRLGNVQKNRSWRIKNLPSGTYYWSVQAIDGGYRGSAWATERTFTKP